MYMNKNKKQALNPEIVGLFCIIIAAVCASIYQPYSSILSDDDFSIYIYGAFSYLGSCVFCIVFFIVNMLMTRKKKEERMLLSSFKDYLFTILSGFSTVGANLFLLTAMRFARASDVSLVTNFEVLVTVSFARFIFKDKVEFYNWIAAPFIVSGAIILSMDFSSGEGVKFTAPLLFALGACICWALENNFSRLVSNKNPYQVTGIKHFIAMIVDFIAVLIVGGKVTSYQKPLMAFGIGSFALGLTFVLYVNAQRRIGAARSSVLYSLSTFLGSLIYLLVMQVTPMWNFYLGAALIFTGQATILIFTILKGRQKKDILTRDLT